MRALILACLIALLAPSAGGATDAASEQSISAGEGSAQVLVFLKVLPSHFRPGGNYASGYSDAVGRSARRRIAEALAQTHGLRMATDWPIPVLGVDCFVMDVPAPLRPQEVADQLASEPQVSWAQVMNIFRPLGHDDPLYNLQPAARLWHLDELHATASGRGVQVAVIDSGVQADHPDLAEQVAVRLNFVADRPDASEIHGTAVAGIIVARADNHVGIAGVAPQARLLALRACWQASSADTLCTSLSLARALSAAIERGAQIINLSLGGPSDQVVQRLIESAQARGIVIVAAINRLAPSGGFPAGLPDVIGVADAAPPFARLGVVIAPGTDIPTTLPGSRWATVSGASYATAHVSGLLALMLDARVRAGSAGAAVHPVGRDLVSDSAGWVDACASLAHVASACVCECGLAPAIESIARH